MSRKGAPIGNRNAQGVHKGVSFSTFNKAQKRVGAGMLGGGILGSAAGLTAGPFGGIPGGLMAGAGVGILGRAYSKSRSAQDYKGYLKKLNK